MKYSKNFKWGIGFGKIGPRAHEVCKAWGLGLHFIRSREAGFAAIRLCLLRTKKCIHYFQITFPYGKGIGCVQG